MGETVKVVLVAAGKDRGKLMAVTAESGGYFYVCNGTGRRLEAPKRKNPKHLIFTAHVLEKSQLETNKRLRTALKRLECENI